MGTFNQRLYKDQNKMKIDSSLISEASVSRVNGKLQLHIIVCLLVEMNLIFEKWPQMSLHCTGYVSNAWHESCVNSSNHPDGRAGGWLPPVG